MQLKRKQHVRFKLNCATRTWNRCSQIKTRKTCHPWPLGCRIPAADGLYLATPIPCPHLSARFKS